MALIPSHTGSDEFTGPKTDEEHLRIYPYLPGDIPVRIVLGSH
jgi:hypothetical protein